MKLKTLCAMIDCSRNAVMTLPALKRFLPILNDMGYNAVMLYTEDTYEIKEYPYFGYLRGRYSSDELKEIDRFAESLGMELIPCIQALGHLEMALKWDFLPKESRDIILPGDERTYEFIDRAFASLSGCIKSRRIHIGMDEAFGLGTGELLKQNGYKYESAVSIIKKHLSRVCKIAEKYGYTILCWSDMFFTEWNGGKYWIEKTDVPKEVAESVPRGVVPVYWDYYSMDYNRYDAMLSNHKQITSESWFAGGIWGWRGMIPYNTYTVNTMTPALDACEKNGTENIIMCLWGDDGNECSRYFELPALWFVAKYANGVRDLEEIKRTFEERFGIPYDTFNLIEELNRPDNQSFGKRDYNPSRFMFYSDPFMGFKDCFVTEEGEAEFSELANKLSLAAKKYPQWSVQLLLAESFARVLSKKYALGLKTRRAYKANDLNELRRLVDECYTPLLDLIPEYLEAFRASWDKENKPFGFDLQDIRIGGVLQRVKSCRARLIDYIEGRISEIPELDEEILPPEGMNIGYGKWRSGAYMITHNVFQGI